MQTVSTSNTYRFGIEEEYFISCQERRVAMETMPRQFFKAAQRAFPDSVKSEMLQSQLEIATKPLQRMGAAREQLTEMRGRMARLAGEHGVALLAAGTHPLARWSRQRQTEAPRYDKVMRDLQMIGARNMLCGLHVHVEIPDPGKRVDLMVRALPFLPLLLALSTSSPFWQARRTGLMGYRLAAYDELPRTGVPDIFADAADYQRYVDTLVATRVIENSSFIWWMLRPSLRHPTLELRVADSCTHLDDAVGIAALYRSLVRHLDLNPGVNAGMAPSSRAIIGENKWRAQRYGIHGSFIDEASQTLIPVRKALDATLAMVAGDASALGCEAELGRLAAIFERGTSADQQIALHTEAVGRGETPTRALRGVVDWLTTATAGAALH